MVNLLDSFNRLKSAKILVLGDFMLDTYTMGKVERISPEAPVPILHVQKSESLPGGAGNVALNLQALGAEVIVVGRVGDDKEGTSLRALLEKEGIDTSGIFLQKGIRTPSKNRLVAGGQQLIRIDQECFSNLSEKIEREIMTHLISMAHEVDVIAISDYAKGFLSKDLLEMVIDFAKESKIPTIVDPKGDDFTKYRGATLIKPNYKEAVFASKLSSEATLDEMARSLFEQTAAEMLMITRSEEGITLFEGSEKRHDFPLKNARKVKDVTGAGDTVLAMTTMVIASGLDLKEGLELSNVAAGIAVEESGCARVSLAQIEERLLAVKQVNSEILHRF